MERNLVPPACITIKLRIWNVNITMTLIPIKLLNFIFSFFRIENLGLYTLHFSIRQIFPKVVNNAFFFCLLQFWVTLDMLYMYMHILRSLIISTKEVILLDQNSAGNLINSWWEWETCPPPKKKICKSILFFFLFSSETGFYTRPVITFQSLFSFKTLNITQVSVSVAGWLCLL